MTLGHQLAAMDISAKSEPNGMVVEYKRTMTYKTKATSVGGKEEKIKKWKEKKNRQYSGNGRATAGESVGG